MQRLTVQPRPNWQSIVEAQGFHFHSLEDQPYWDESAAYLFSRPQIDQIEEATYALNDLCLQAIPHIIEQNLFPQFQIPPQFIPWIIESWKRDELTIYGRFDLAYDGRTPPKLLEYNADTPTSLLEAAVIQWFWFREVQNNPQSFSPDLPSGPTLDQFNSIHERLIEAWKSYTRILAINRASHSHFNPTLYFAALRGIIEDFMTTTYLRDTAVQAGLTTQYIDIEDVGFNSGQDAFVDLAEKPIHQIFKLYPWEWMVREQFAPQLQTAGASWLEAPWKMLLSNKAILPILFELNPDSPYLLPASQQLLAGPQVRKPILSREGANIAIIDGNRIIFENPGPYGPPHVYQQLFPLPDFDGNHPIIGSWMVNGYACGIGIREDTSPITGNTSRFIPHLFTN
ncbi:MAG TPA: glutathionylspermidine synthase family protein [Tepidisphaeraceae bacterium]|jgi:glutathionylspermidine synthase|nr:glutathionylspermidine synthase family protein [Tepidisphaeraceae bacterium]